jgi:hypothetical protein
MAPGLQTHFIAEDAMTTSRRFRQSFPHDNDRLDPVEARQQRLGLKAFRNGRALQ